MTKKKLDSAVLLIANAVIALREQETQLEETLDAIDHVAMDPEFRKMLPSSTLKKLADLDA